MRIEKNRLLPAAVLSMTLGIAGNPVMAASTALSVNEITNFSLSATQGGFTLFDFTFSNDTAATESGGTGGADTADAPAACVGDCAGWENEFWSHDPYSTEFSYGDAQIQNDEVSTASGVASSIGEVVVTEGIGHASGSNVLTSGIFSIDANTVLNFSFNANPLMQTTVSGTGLASAANLFFNISLTDNLNTEIFSWSPNGAGAISGGTSIYDPFSLNYGIAGNTTYDPGNDLFNAETNELAAGQYNLNIKMENQVNGTAVVPVPAAAWLFGSGLIGLVGLARRKA